MKKSLCLLFGLILMGYLNPAKAEEADCGKQEVEVKNSYLNVTSVNKKETAHCQKVVIDKCFLSIIRINLGDKEVPVEVVKE